MPHFLLRSAVQLRRNNCGVDERGGGPQATRRQLAGWRHRARSRCRRSRDNAMTMIRLINYRSSIDRNGGGGVTKAREEPEQQRCAYHK